MTIRLTIKPKTRLRLIQGGLACSAQCEACDAIIPKEATIWGLCERCIIRMAEDMQRKPEIIK